LCISLLDYHLLFDNVLTGMLYINTHYMIDGSHTPTERRGERRGDRDRDEIERVDFFKHRREEGRERGRRWKEVGEDGEMHVCMMHGVFLGVYQKKTTRERRSRCPYFTTLCGNAEIAFCNATPNYQHQGECTYVFWHYSHNISEGNP
jgi:hypothetical protein